MKTGRFFRACSKLHFLSLSAVCVFLASSAVAGDAPDFTLPLFDRSGFVSSSTLFAEHDATFLVFWHTGCPVCVQRLRECEGFLRLYGGGGIEFLGIIVGDEDVSDVRRVIRQAGVSFRQAVDSGAMVSRRYGVSPGSFSVVLVDRSEVIRGRIEDPKGDISGALERMLLSGSSGSVGKVGEVEEQVASHVPRFRVVGDSIETSYVAGRRVKPVSGTGELSGGFVIGGISRLRFLSVSSNVSSPVGPYGERVTPGDLLSYRMELELKRKITDNLLVGGLLRLSNEGREVLEAGPEYLGTEWGSAFAEFEAKRVSVRLGYYDIHATPLTLMRWDWDDNPRIGGDAGCGCGAAAGVLLMESLEELGPDLRFEGGRARVTTGDFSGTVYYAIPVRALRTSQTEYRWTGRFAHYSKEVAGASLVWSRYFPIPADVVTLGTSIVHTWEDENSVDYASLGYAAPLPWTSASVASLFFKLPVSSLFSVNGECVFYNRSETTNPIVEDEGRVEASEACAGILGFSLDTRRLDARFDYITIDKDFYSPFAAISYEPNREGFRVGGRILPFSESFAFSFFVKRLREIENETPELPFERVLTMGFAADMDLDGGIGGSAGWMRKENVREDGSYHSSSERETTAVSFRYRFNRSCYVQIQYERILFRPWASVMSDEKTNIAGLYFSSRF